MSRKPSRSVWVSAVLACVAAAGCGEGGRGEQPVRFRIADETYSVPSRQILSIKREPPGFVRIKDPDSPVELVFDARLQGRTDEAGVPLLFSINDGNYPRVSRWKTKEGALIVCREAAARPRGGCGTPVRYGGATWSVIFPERSLGQAATMQDRAAELLDHWAG